MKREEIIAKWDGMTPRERDALVAEVIFGTATFMDEELNAWAQYPHSTANHLVPEYTTDIYAAWSVLEHPGSDGLPIVWAIYPTADGYNVEYALGHEVVSAPTAPEAIGLAAIIAKLTN